MKKFLLTLMAVASLTIVSQAQTETAIYRPETGAAQNDDGSWSVFTGTPIVTLGHSDKFFIDSKLASDAALDDLNIPAVARPNGLAFRKSLSHKESNHDGLAFQGLNTLYASRAAQHADVLQSGYTFSDSNVGNSEAAGPTESADALVLAESIYAKNIKSGKWHKFVNGE